jgi:hypothetical protein
VAAAAAAITRSDAIKAEAKAKLEAAKMEKAAKEATAVVEKPAPEPAPPTLDPLLTHNPPLNKYSHRRPIRNKAIRNLASFVDVFF